MVKKYRVGSRAAADRDRAFFHLAFRRRQAKRLQQLPHADVVGYRQRPFGSTPLFIFEDGFGYERYADYALDVPMYFVYRDGHYIDCAGQSFRAFMDGKLPALPGQHPTLNDWAI